MKRIYLICTLVLTVCVASAQTFTNSSNLLPSAANSGGCTGVADMDNDGLDDVIILDQSTDLKIAYQQADGTFEINSFGTVSSDQQWGMCIGDIDNDGHKDVICGGYYDNVHLININAPSDYEQIELTWANIFTQGCNIADIDNDGWLDAFVCHDDGHSAIPHNDGTGSMTDGASMMDLTFYPEVNGNDNSGNYGSVWTDFDRDGDLDLFIAKCRQFINDPYDPRRTNILMVNDGNNNYSEQAMERGLVNLQQSWTSDFADMDNDGDFDVLLTTHSNTLEIYANDGAGYFTNVTAGSGLEVSGFFLQAKMADFDNDGFQDLVYAGGVEGFFHNNGDMTFTLIEDLFSTVDNLHSFGLGDLNNDGYMDLYASYGDGYVDFDNSHDDRLFINDGGTNNYITFDLEGTISNKDACGALVEIHGAWGVQIREVRDGESYGITNTSKCHFGIGAATEVDYAIIHWPAGGMDVIDNPAINQTHDYIEGACTPPTATISSAGSTNICVGQEVTLTIVAAGNNYVWSNGMETNSITVTTPGIYSLIVWDAEGCGAYSNQIPVNVVTDEVPTITVNGDFEFCQGNTVQLLASTGTSYSWSNDQTTPAITVTETGDYSVTVVGTCQELSSESVHIEVYDTPVIPTVIDISVQSGETATFTVTNGTDVRWYDSATSTTPVFEGSSMTTSVLTETTSYWVEDVMTYGGLSGNGGKTENSTETGQYQASANYYLIFDALSDVYINTVKVYAQAQAIRTIEVFDNNGVSIASGDFDIPDGESLVNLNFFVPEGIDYSIRITSNNPLLWRDKDLSVDAPFNYPYNVGDLVTITQTNVGGSDADNYYYFFYEWNVSTPTWECASGREEVQAIVTGVNELTGVSELKVYPNPASTILNVNLNTLNSGKMTLILIDQTGRTVKTTQWATINGSNFCTIDLTDVAAGMYQFRISANGKSATTKVVVE